jgi:hypothetical protein
MTSLSEAFDGTQLASNFYFDGTNDKYIKSDFATAYLQIDGTHRWRICRIRNSRCEYYLE